MVIYLTLKKLRFSSQAICHVNSMISKENPKDSLCFKNVRLATLCFKPQYIVAKNVLKVDKLCFKNGQVLVNGTLRVAGTITWPKWPLYGSKPDGPFYGSTAAQRFRQ